MRVAVLCYHKNVTEIYAKEWVDKYRESIKNQTYKEFQVFEINYGGTNERIFESYAYPTFVHALNYLLDKTFSSGYDVVYNTNCDDYYANNWIETLLSNIGGKYDLVTSNFCLVKDEKIIKYHLFHNLDILYELEHGHNPVAHPAICYTKKFWDQNRYVPDEMPIEDMLLWTRALRAGTKIFISKENLLFHRIHQNAVCRSDNR